MEAHTAIRKEEQTSLSIIVHQLKKESKHLEKKSKELKEDEKGKEAAVDDL